MKIISGGQTGVDRAALDAALELGLEIGGWCPKLRRAEDGVIPGKYPLRETPSFGYMERTTLNVRQSDATLILSPLPLSSGTARTAEIARGYDKPLAIMDLQTPPSALELWLYKYKPQTLNIAGPRESKVPGIYVKAKEWLLKALASKEYEEVTPGILTKKC